VVVLDTFLCPEVAETGWSGLRNWTVHFGGCREMVLAFVLFFVFTSGTLFCSAATSPGLFSALGLASSLAEDSLPGPVFS
jgi:hypothetical protein